MGLCILLPTYSTYLTYLNTLVSKYVCRYIFFSFPFLSWRVSYILGWKTIYRPTYRDLTYVSKCVNSTAARSEFLRVVENEICPSVACWLTGWRALSPKFPSLLQCISPREKKGTRGGEGTEEEEEQGGGRST